MSDPASLLAWGRSIVAAKRGVSTVGGGHWPQQTTPSSPAHLTSSPASPQRGGGGTSSSSPAAAPFRAAASAVPSSRPHNNTIVLDDMHAASMKRRPSGAPASTSVTNGVVVVPPSTRSAIKAFAAAASTPADDDDPSRQGGSEPVEANEPHWHWLHRMEGSATSSNAAAMSGGSNPSTHNNPLNASATSNNSQQGQRLSTMVRRRGSLGDTARPPAAATPAHVSSTTFQDASHIMMMLTHDEEILRRRLDAEKKHVAELETMRDRNHAEFQHREAELLAELEALPKALQESEHRRSARLTKSTTYVQEHDLRNLEEILWTLESRVHAISEEEEQFGKDVHAHAECIETTGVMTVESRDLLLESTLPALRRVPALLDSLRRRSTYLGTGSATPQPSPPLLVDVPGVRSELLQSTEVLQEAFHLTPSTAIQPLTPEKMFEVSRDVLQTSIKPFLQDVERVTAALRTLRVEQVRERALAVQASDAQLADQKLTMDEAHNTLSGLLRDREMAEEEIDQTAKALSELQLLLETTAKAHESDVQRANTLMQRKSSLDEEVRELKEIVAVAKREVSELQLAERRQKMIHDSNVARCEELREQSRAASKSQVDTADTQMTKLQRNVRTTQGQLEQHQRDIQRLSNSITSVKHHLAQVKDKQADTQRRLEAHSMEKYRCEREHFELAKEADELERAHEAAHNAIETLRRDTATCREEVYLGRQELHDAQESVVALTDQVQDAEEELELVRAVLLFQEEGGSRGGVAHSRTAATLAAKVALEDRALLWSGSGSPPRAVVAGQLRGANPQSKSGMSFRDELSGDTAEQQGQGGRGQAWAPQPGGGASPTGDTTTIHPPEDLDTVEPPSEWQNAAAITTSSTLKPPTPIVVTPHPRHFHRELQALQSTREESKMALIEFLRDEAAAAVSDGAKVRDDDTSGETGSSATGGDRSSSAQSYVEAYHTRRDPNHHPHHHTQQFQPRQARATAEDQQQVKPLQKVPQWQHAPSVMVAHQQRASDDERLYSGRRYSTGQYRSPSTRSSSSAYSSPPASEPDVTQPQDVSRRQAQQQYAQHSNAAFGQQRPQQASSHAHHGGLQHSTVPAFLPPHFGTSQQQEAARQHQRDDVRHAQQQRPDAPQHDDSGQPTTLRGRLSQVKSKLQRVVSDHSAPPRKPFR